MMDSKDVLLMYAKKYRFILLSFAVLVIISAYLYIENKPADAADSSEPMTEEKQVVIAAIDMMKENMVAPEYGEFDAYGDHELWQMNNAEGTWVVNGHFIRENERAAYEARLYRNGSEWVMVELSFPFDWEERTAN